jgi:hypothetical protein
LIRLRLAWMLLYSPLGIISLPFSSF